jgi:hypothetical protein
VNPQHILFFLLLSFMIACTPQGNSMTHYAHQATSQNDQTNDFIGFANMEADGTLILRLNAYLDDGETVGRGYFRYPPDHPEYGVILRHVGPIKPGEEKPVRPWPETSGTKP